jgi:hypothetical protein
LSERKPLDLEAGSIDEGARAFDLNADHPIIRIEIQYDPGGHCFRLFSSVIIDLL